MIYKSKHDIFIQHLVCCVYFVFVFVLNNWGYGTPTFNIQMSPNPKMKYRIPPTQRLSSNFFLCAYTKVVKRKIFHIRKISSTIMHLAAFIRFQLAISQVPSSSPYAFWTTVLFSSNCHTTAKSCDTRLPSLRTQSPFLSIK